MKPTVSRRSRTHVGYHPPTPTGVGPPSFFVSRKKRDRLRYNLVYKKQQVCNSIYIRRRRPLIHYSPFINEHSELYNRHEVPLHSSHLTPHSSLNHERSVWHLESLQLLRPFSPFSSRSGEIKNLRSTSASKIFGFNNYQPLTL